MKQLLLAVLSLAAAAGAADNSVERIFGAGKMAAVRYPRKLEFYTLPATMDVCRPDKRTQLKICSSGKEVPLSLKPSRTLSLKHSFDIWPMDLWEPREKPYLVCSTPLHDRGHLNEKGEDQFCGVVAVTGEVIYKFPLVQSKPALLAASLGISKDGKRAALVTGEGITVHGEDGEYNDVGNLKEIWIWESPNKLTKVPAQKFGKHWRDLMRLFHAGKI